MRDVLTDPTTSCAVHNTGHNFAAFSLGTWEEYRTRSEHAERHGRACSQASVRSCWFTRNACGSSPSTGEEASEESERDCEEPSTASSRLCHVEYLEPLVPCRGECAARCVAAVLASSSSCRSSASAVAASLCVLAGSAAPCRSLIFLALRAASTFQDLKHHASCTLATAATQRSSTLRTRTALRQALHASANCRLSRRMLRAPLIAARLLRMADLAHHFSRILHSMRSDLARANLSAMTSMEACVIPAHVIVGTSFVDK
jgi:hypothetical protein